jgi:hypothetical protein
MLAAAATATESDTIPADADGLVQLGALHGIVTGAVTERRGTSVLVCRNGSTEYETWCKALSSLTQLQYSGLKPVLVDINLLMMRDEGILNVQILEGLHKVIGSTVKPTSALAESRKHLKALLTKTEHSGSGTEEPMIVMKLLRVGDLKYSTAGWLQQFCEMANAPNSRLIVLVAQVFGTYVEYDDTDLELQLQHTITI